MSAKSGNCLQESYYIDSHPIIRQQEGSHIFLTHSIIYCGQMQPRPRAYKQHLVEELEGEGQGEGVRAGPGGGGHIQLHPEQRGQLPAATAEIKLDTQLESS